jgi:hypothetical protein
MTTLMQLFDFVSAQRTAKIICGLTLTSNTPRPSPPPSTPFVAASTCYQESAAAISWQLGDLSTVSFPQVMMYQESFYWPYKNPPGGAPGEGEFFNVAIKQRFHPIGLGIPKVLVSYWTEMVFPWGPSVVCTLSEDSSGVVYGSDGTTMITMTIGTPSI